MTINGADTWYWGFEVMNSSPSTTDPTGITVYGPRVKLINLVVHDAGQSGIGFWSPAVDAEIYGCLIYNNGRNTNLDHGIYAQNASGTKRIVDNVIFNNWAYGIHIYGSSSARLTGFYIAGNASFDNGSISPSVVRPNILVGGVAGAGGIQLVGNFTYTNASLNPAGSGKAVEFGYDTTANNDILAQDNTFIGGLTVLRLSRWNAATFTRNTFFGPVELIKLEGGTAGWTWNNNVWYTSGTYNGGNAWVYNAVGYSWTGWKTATGLGATDQNIQPGSPTSPIVIVRPNQYEPGRAHVIVYNWALQPAVAVNVSGFLQPGDHYEVRNVQDYFGPPVSAGIYSGGTISLSLSGILPPLPIGGTSATPPTTGPELNVYVVVKTN